MEGQDLDVFALAQSLLNAGASATPDQRAQLRALNTRHFTALYALQEHARDEGRLPSPGELAALNAETTQAVRLLIQETRRRP